MVTHLVDRSYNLTLGVIGTAQHKIDDPLGILFAVPTAVAGIYFLSFLRPQVQALQLA